MNGILICFGEKADAPFVKKLKAGGYGVSIARTCKEAEKAAAAGSFRAAVCFGRDNDAEKLYSLAGTGLPVIAAACSRNLTADLLEHGICDVLAGPYDAGELFCRLRALLRRLSITESFAEGSSALMANPYTRTVSVEGQSFNLPRREYKLLQTLISKPGHIFSRDELMTDAWGQDCESGERTVDVHIKRLREKLEGFGRFIISTVRGQGYKLEFIQS